MESTQRLVRSWMTSGREQEISKIVLEISNGQTTLLNVVKALADYLTAEEDKLRAKGVEFLALVVGRCPPENLNRQSARVLVSFYCSKLDDIETVIPALQGLVSLTALPACNSTDATAIVEALFQHVKMKAMVQSNRFLVFSIIDTLMARHRDALKGMGKRFLSEYIALAEGEKDPRNLLLAFAIARVILIEFDISDHVEALFNITYCYFPITFRPPPNDPYGITTDDLKMALLTCLNAAPAFGPLAIPIFLEKLTAGSPATKRDALQTMSSCFPVYGSNLASGSARKLWNSLKLEIFQPTDPVTEEEALKTMQVLIRTIYADDKGSDGANDDIQGLAREACEECIEILREPEKTRARPAIKVLCTFMSTTPCVSRYTVSQAVPHLVKLFLTPDEISNRPAILVLLSDLMTAAHGSTVKDTQTLAESDIPFMPFKDEVLGVVTAGLKSAASCRPALHGLKAMVTTKALMTEEELGFVVHNVTEILKADPNDSDDVSDAVIDLLSTISALSPLFVEEQTLPLLFTSLPDHPPPREARAERAKCSQILSALSQLCLQPELFETLVIRLTTKLDFVCVPSRKYSDVEPGIAYAHSILTTLAKILAQKVDLGHADISKYIDRLVPRLYNLFIFSSLVSDGTYMVAAEPQLVRVAAQIITLVVQTIPLQYVFVLAIMLKQEIFAGALFSAYLSGDVKGIAEGHRKVSSESKFLPFSAGVPVLQKNLVALFSAAVIPFRKELRIPVPDLRVFLDMLLSWSLSQAEDNLHREAAWHMISSIVNKQTPTLSTFLLHKLEHFWPQEIGDIGRPLENRQHAIRSWIWISKALLVQNHVSSQQFTNCLFDVFDDTINWEAARALGEIGGSDTILTKRNHATIKILYAQKFFNGILPRIMVGAKMSSNPQSQAAYLVALTSLIKSIPRTTYIHEMPLLMPLLLRALELPDNDARVNVIDTFLATAEGEPAEQSIVSEHATTLVLAMLKNILVQDMPSTRVRIAALRYLGRLPNIVRYDVLHPAKSSVIRGLARVLDDPRRSVRKEAVDARTNWFKYNG